MAVIPEIIRERMKLKADGVGGDLNELVEFPLARGSSGRRPHNRFAGSTCFAHRSRRKRLGVSAGRGSAIRAKPIENRNDFLVADLT